MKWWADVGSPEGGRTLIHTCEPEAGSEEGEMSNVWRRFWEDESGQSLVEYVLIIALIAIAVIGSLAFIRDRMKENLTSIADCLGNPEDCPEP